MHVNLCYAFTGKMILICAVLASQQWTMRMITLDLMSLYIINIQDLAKGYMIMYVYSVSRFFIPFFSCIYFGLSFFFSMIL